MGTYISLINWTDQGIKNVKDSPARLDAAKQLAKKLGCELKQFFMTIGAYDMVAVMEAPDDEAAAKFTLILASGGNVRTSTLKAFDEATYRKIVSGL
ncbi:MAG TPA: GYD domain-containing protein [Bauldia sp.]|nr:GYD domain-containing protein [Bauldia sp.]